MPVTGPDLSARSLTNKQSCLFLNSYQLWISKTAPTISQRNFSDELLVNTNLERSLTQCLFSKIIGVGSLLVSVSFPYMGSWRGYQN